MRFGNSFTIIWVIFHDKHPVDLVWEGKKKWKEKWVKKTLLIVSCGKKHPKREQLIHVLSKAILSLLLWRFCWNFVFHLLWRIIETKNALFVVFRLLEIDDSNFLYSIQKVVQNNWSKFPMIRFVHVIQKNVTFRSC